MSALKEMYASIKSEITHILFGEELRNYRPQWGGHGVNINRKHRLAQAVFKHEDEPGILENAQVAYEYLINQFTNFDLTKEREFITFESLFYNILTYTCTSQRNSAKSENLISIEFAKGKLDDVVFHYISIIYAIVQLQFWWWINRKEAFYCKRINNAEKFGVHFKVNAHENGTKELWQKIKELASNAHKVCCYGELASRFMFISDIQLIYGLGKQIPYYNEKNRELVKYMQIGGEDSFIKSCFTDSPEKPFFITGLPCLQDANYVETCFKTDYEYCQYLGIMGSPEPAQVDVDVKQ